MHHVRKLKDLKGKSDWEKNMIARRRKTLAVCSKCHAKIAPCLLYTSFVLFVILYMVGIDQWVCIGFGVASSSVLVLSLIHISHRHP